MQSDVAQTADPVVAAPVLSLSRSDGFFEFDSEQCRAAGDLYHERYVNADPFPHIVFDNLIDIDVLRRVVDEFPGREKGRFSDGFSQLKTGYVHGQIRSAYVHDLLSALNSAAFLFFLQRLTGIKGLTSDPHFLGGGLHETARGGFLKIHADFNLHPHTKLHRRLNLILFLNEEWQGQWGGALELWDQKMTACRTQVQPVLGRAVIFNTDSTSYHGHPDPLACPADVMRRSIALYYYTAPSSAGLLPHTTLFQARPGSDDERPSFKDRVLDRVKRAVKLRVD
jgi:Rps23 Pro-64 3,4-dihydroxylase Tpa1-like proline 4-hydroxylase